MVGCLDATFGQSSLVEEVATGLVPSRPRANRRIGTSSEAPDEGASARRSRASRRIVCFRWGSATGSRANWRFWSRPRLFIPLVLFLGSKQFFDLRLGYPIFWYPTVAPEPRAGVWDTLPEVFFETFVSQWLLLGLLYTRDSGGCARAHPPGVAPEALEE